MYLAGASIRLLLAGLVTAGAGGAALGQSAPGGPPAVGIVEATRRPITETSEFLGRIEAVNRVNVVARVTAFLEKRLFEEGNEIKAGDHLYRLERGPVRCANLPMANLSP
jgi:membrane fusion protein, multidrug efflux system